MSAKRFFHISAGLFLLVAAYTLGASRVQGQVFQGQISRVQGAGKIVS